MFYNFLPFFSVDHKVSRFTAKNNVFPYCHIVDQHKMLMHHSQSHFKCFHCCLMFDLIPINFDASPVRLVKPKQNLHQCSFSCTIFSKQTMNLSLFHKKFNLVICDHSRKALCNPTHFYRIHSIFPPYLRIDVFQFS